MKLSIIIPVYNEEKTISKVLQKVAKVKIPDIEKEIIVVDDGSTDATASEISNLKSQISNIKFLQHKKNQGKGAAVRTGITKATGDYIIIQDADLEYDPQDIVKLIEPVRQGRAQVVYGTRLKRWPNFSRDERTFQFLLHYLGNKFLSLLTSLLYFHWVTDMESCYKLFPKDAVKNIKLESKGFEFEPEITAKLLKKEYKILDVPISTNPRGYNEGKKINTIKDGVKALSTLIKYRFNDPYSLAVLGIILLTIFLRFYDYGNRWGLAYDQAHDALLAHYAVENFKLPLLGPFSSAGPFQTGGEWYWLVMVGTAIAPYFLISPWLFITSLYVLFVFIITLVAKEINGKQFAVLTGFFAAISTAQISQGTHLTNQSPMALMSLLSIWFAVLFLTKQKIKYIFFLGLCVGIASSIHLSGAGLIFLIISLFIIHRRFHYREIAAVFIGILIPWIPVLIADSQNNFANFRNMVYYYLHDQYNIPFEALGRRWLTYLGAFWPQQWAFIIGGFSIIAYIIGASSVFVLRTIKREMLMLLLGVLGMIILLRYTHTPIFSSYLVFMHPFILIITAWIVFSFIKKKKIFKFLGVVLLLIIVAGTLFNDYLAFKSFENFSRHMAEDQISALKNNYGNKKFSVYIYKDKWKEKNFILALYLEKANMLDRNGFKISTVYASPGAKFKNPILWGDEVGYQLINLDSSSSSQLEKHGWRFVDGEAVYEETENWFR